MPQPFEIDLTDVEQKKLAEFAQQRGISLEEAAALAASKTITAYWVIPKKASAVVQFRRK